MEMAEALDATARSGSRELRERIRTFARQRLGEGVALVRLQALLERAGRAADKRNEVMHVVWRTELDGDPMVRGEDHQFRPAPSISELHDLEWEITRVLDALTQARQDGFLSEALKTKPLSSAESPVRRDIGFCSRRERVEYECRVGSCNVAAISRQLAQGRSGQIVWLLFNRSSDRGDLSAIASTHSLPCSLYSLISSSPGAPLMPPRHLINKGPFALPYATGVAFVFPVA